MEQPAGKEGPRPLGLDAAEFAAAILRVFDHRASLDDQARRGRSVAEEHEWANIGQRFADVVANVARGDG